VVVDGRVHVEATLVGMLDLAQDFPDHVVMRLARGSLNLAIDAESHVPILRFAADRLGLSLSFRRLCGEAFDRPTFPSLIKQRLVLLRAGVGPGASIVSGHFRAAGAPYDYFWEERWIRDEGYLKIGVEAVRAALANAKLGAAEVAKFIFPSPSKGAADAIARAVGLPAASVADPLDVDCGFVGAAQSLLMLANVLDQASPGDVVVVAGFGQGSDVIVLRATDAVVAVRPARKVSDALSAGVTVRSYAQMASFYDEITPDWGMRAERDTKTALTEQYRSSDQINGFVAGRCSSCGQVQFPQLAYCVNCRAPASGLVPVCLADEAARVLTYTADMLT